jgi:DNA replication protein DnaC
LKPVVCPQCKKLRPPTIFDICGQCWRKQQLISMPESDREWAVSQVIPPLFALARLEHLPAKLVEKIKALPETKGLMFWGPAGRGKSYALSAIAREYILQGFIVARTTYEMLCLRLRDSFKAKSTCTELSIIQPYLEAEKLIIEDVGTTKSEGGQESDFSVRTILVLIDYRLENCLPTFITTNRPVEELEKTFDARVSSRLIQACEIVKLSGDDRRKNGI